MITVIDHGINGKDEQMLYDLGWRKCGMGGVLWNPPGQKTTYKLKPAALEQAFVDCQIPEWCIELGPEECVDMVNREMHIHLADEAQLQAIYELQKIKGMCDRKQTRKAAISKYVNEAIELLQNIK